MTKKLKQLDLFFREVQDPYAQENFYRLKAIINDLVDCCGTTTDSGTGGSTGGGGTGGGGTGTAATEAPLVVKTFTTDAGTLAGHLVRVNADNTVTRITANSYGLMPHGIFGVVLSKPGTLVARVAFMGIVSGYSGFTAGLPLFVSTSGTPTHTAPATGMVQRIGFAVSATEMWVSPMQAFRRA